MARQYDWGTWLKRYNDLLLKQLDREELPYYPKNIVQAVKAQWLGLEAAEEAEVEALENRLGQKLPPSYRQFLLTSNGFLQPGMLVPRLYSTSEVTFLDDAEKALFNSWQTSPADDSAFKDDNIFFQHIHLLIVISEQEESGSARYFLNPKRMNKDGEWEAYSYADWDSPPSTRYESFWDLMQREFKFLRDEAV